MDRWEISLLIKGVGKSFEINLVVTAEGRLQFTSGFLGQVK